MLNKSRVRMLIGVFFGAIIGAFITKFTHPMVWFIVIVILSLSLIIDWDTLNKNK